jgi:hypothetical protein
VTFPVALVVVALVLVLLGWILRWPQVWAMAFANLAAIVGALALFEVYLGYWQPEAQPYLLQRMRQLFAKVRWYLGAAYIGP